MFMQQAKERVMKLRIALKRLLIVTQTLGNRTSTLPDSHFICPTEDASAAANARWSNFSLLIGEFRYTTLLVFTIVAWKNND